MSIKEIPFRNDIDDFGVGARHWAFIIKVGTYPIKYTGFYSTGSAIKGIPTLISVLDSLSLDTRDVNNQSFLEWVDNFGYDSDSIKALKIYNACLDEYRDLCKVLNQADRKAIDQLHSCESL